MDLLNVFVLNMIQTINLEGYIYLDKIKKNKLRNFDLPIFICIIATETHN